MGVSSSKLEPAELATFKKLPRNVPLDHIQVPEGQEYRKQTNVIWLIVLGIAILVLVLFMTYTLYYSDGRRILGGYDKCGNLCGQRNYRWDNISCSGQDLTYKPYLEFDFEDVFGGKKLEEQYRERHCVEFCRSEYVPVSGRCVREQYQPDNDVNFYPELDVKSDKSDLNSIGYDGYFDQVKWQIIISGLLSILVTIGMIFLFRYAVFYVVWGILYGTLVGVLVLAGVSGYFLASAPENMDTNHIYKRVLIGMIIIFLLVALALGAVVIWSRKKVHLVIMLLEDTTQAIFDMPGLMVLPVISIVVVLVLTGLYGITTFYMASAGTLQHLRVEFYLYLRNPVMIFTMAYNSVMYLWLCKFFGGIQCMVIAGAVSKWYFTRDKYYLDEPIMTSLSNTFRFHLGTVALGSLIITVIQVLKKVISGMIKNQKGQAAAETAMNAVQRICTFLSNNAYIITAMHGQPFIKSGKRAVQLIIQNIGDVISINFMGGFVLGMAKFLIIVITVLLSMAVFVISQRNVLTSDSFAYMTIAFIAGVIAYVSFGVFEITIDTLFICFCEDSLLNDGTERPYFMSRNLMEFIQGSKRLQEEAKAKKEKREQKK